MFQLNDEQKKQAAQVLLDSTKPGAVVYCRIRLPANSPWGIATKPVWILHEFEYKVRFPDENLHRSCDGCVEYARFYLYWTRRTTLCPFACEDCWAHLALESKIFANNSIRKNWKAADTQLQSDGSPALIEPKPAPEPEPAPKYRPWATIDEVPISIRLRRKTGKEWGWINGAKMDMKNDELIVAVGASWVGAWALFTYWDWDIGQNVMKPCGVLLDKKGNDAS